MLFQNCIPVKNSDISPRLIKMTFFYQKTLGWGMALRAPPKSLDRMWHTPVFAFLWW